MLQWHQQEKEMASLFLAFTICSHCEFATAAGAAVARQSFLRFCPFLNKIGLNTVPPILNRLRLETKYELMIMM